MELRAQPEAADAAQGAPPARTLRSFGALRTDVRTVRQFDDAYTAPHHGFRDADDYYHRASSLRVIDQIAIPTLILSAADDPFVPPEQFGDPVQSPPTRI